MEIEFVMIVGAGPAGLATAACLSNFSIPYIIIEREDCSVSLWRKHTYNCLKLHLAKEFCALPYMPFPTNTPTYMKKEQFLKYLDNYIECFHIRPRYNINVMSCAYDNASKSWIIIAQDLTTEMEIKYATAFLVVATGENSVGNIPTIPGLQDFPGEVIHSSGFKSGAAYVGKSVLIVGCGNSGMDIAYDLVRNDAKTSIVIRSPLHVMTKELIRLGMKLMQYLPVKLVDSFIVMLANFWFGDLSKYGIVRPNMGPLLHKAKTGRSAVIDVGTIELIKTGNIKVHKGVSNITANMIRFEDGKKGFFDTIVLATGYKSTANMWLKNAEMLNNDGMPKTDFPNHWKGDNKLYCAGLGRRGLAGIAFDAKIIAMDIMSTMKSST